MSARRLLGGFLIGLPFSCILGFLGASVGFGSVLIVLAITVTFFACIIGGVAILRGGLS